MQFFWQRNPTYHSKTKNIDVQYHFVRDMIEGKKVSLMKVDTLKNVVDSLTRSLSTEKFSWCRGSMGIATLDFWLCNPVTPLYAKKTTSGRMLGMCYILCMSSSVWAYALGAQGGSGAAAPKFFFGPTYFRWFWADIFSPGRHISRMTYFRDDILPGPHDIRWFSAHGFLPMVFYFPLRN